MMSTYEYDVCVVGGLGHVGLPLAILLASKGKRVMVYDLNKEAIATVSQGRMPFMEEGAEKLLKKVLGKTLFISSDKNVISDSHYIVVVIGTPADRHLNPEFTVFKKFFDEVIDIIRDDQHIILRSTVFPGTTEKLKHYLESKSKSTKLSFCPERIAQGKATTELCSLPQIIGSFNEESKDEARRLFSLLTKEMVYLEPQEAELAKLFTNIWRYIQFSIGNQFYQIATEHNMDFYKIYDAIVYKYPRAKDFTSAGFAAGPCLFKDTAHMVAYTGNSFFLGNSAMLINEGLPHFILQKLKDKYRLKDKTVGILGMAFKADIDDKRDSLSYKLKNMLEMETNKVLCTDVYVREDGFVGEEEIVRDSDIIILAAPHKEYLDLKIPESKILVDVWNFYGKGGLF